VPTEAAAGAAPPLAAVRPAPKVAIVHDWLVVHGGAERVLGEMIRLFPDADVYSTVCFVPGAQSEFLHGKRPRTTFIQRLPLARRHYRAYLPLMPLAIEQLDLSAYDVVISSSYAVAKGVITGPDQLHVSYVHSPIRYAWDLQHSYLREAGLERGLRSALTRLLLHYVRLWDTRTINGVDRLLANSAFVARRVRKAYGRPSTVVHPPVHVDRFTPGPRHERGDFYLTASRLVPYKRVPLIVEAFAATPERRLVVIGEGPDEERVRAAARGAPNVAVLGRQPEDVLVDHMRRARAFVFAAQEDFGIAPVEAQACGTPVIAFGRGGALESVRGEPGAGQTGVFFHEQSVPAIAEAVARFEAVAHRIRPEACRESALRFSAEAFRARLREVVEDGLREFRPGLAAGEAHLRAEAA
jgi:glycosyltransferase involved in cell wall biosynthesis